MSEIPFIGPIEPADRGTARIIDTGSPNLPIDWAREERQEFARDPVDPVSLLKRADRIAYRISVCAAFLLGAATAFSLFGWRDLRRRRVRPAAGEPRDPARMTLTSPHGCDPKARLSARQSWRKPSWRSNHPTARTPVAVVSRMVRLAITISDSRETPWVL